MTQRHSDKESAAGSPRALIGRYWGEVWNERHAGRIPEICRDPIVRHDPMCVNALTCDEQVERVRQQSAAMHPYFTHEVLLGDDRFVCSVWNMFTRATGGVERPDIQLSGIEVFEAANGRLTDCWNSAYSKGFWGRTGGDADPTTPRSIAGATDAGGEGDAGTLAARFLAALAAGDAAALRAIAGDDLIRYRAGEQRALSIDDLLDAAHTAATIDCEALFAEGDYACAIWNRRSGHDGADAMCGIDVVRQAGGRIVEWWSPPEKAGAWGRDGDSAVVTELPPPGLLTSVGDIDETWMQAALQHAGLDLPRISLLTAAPIGHGNMSETMRVTIGYNKPVTDEITSVVCKFNSNYPDAQALAAAISPYRAEACAYRYFGATPPMRTARAYHAGLSDDWLTVNLVLEDLGAFCEPGDQIAGCSIEDAAAVVHELARMHARYWNAPELKSLPWMALNRPRASAPPYYDLGVRVFEERYAADLGEADMSVIRAFAPLADIWRAHTHTDFTLLHADPRVDNVMFDRRGRVPSAYLIDWQMVGWGNSARDLAYFLTGSLTVDDRRACERDLLVAHARQIVAVDPTYTEAAACESYRTETVSGLHATVGAAAVMPDTPHNRDLLTVLARRNVSAVRDWDALDHLSKRRSGASGPSTARQPAG